MHLSVSGTLRVPLEATAHGECRIRCVPLATLAVFGKSSTKHRGSAGRKLKPPARPVETSVAVSAFRDVAIATLPKRNAAWRGRAATAAGERAGARRTAFFARFPAA